MESVAYWKIIRVLTTNTCNFDCVFCHNEGQVVKSTRQYLSLDDFVKIISALRERPLSEIQFSGGEPFLNPDTIKMIEWAHKNTDYEIGCATNMSLLDYALIKRLSKTRVTFNIQFPSSNIQNYNKITNSSYGDSILPKILLLKDLGIKFKLNYVWLKENIESLSNIIDFCLKQNYGLKILPFISMKTLKYNYFRDLAINYITPILGYPNIKAGGALRWVISNGDEHIVIKYVDTPCFNNDINKCKNYAELRLLPNLQLQFCLLQTENITISIKELNSPELIINKIDLLWKNFSNC